MASITQPTLLRSDQIDAAGAVLGRAFFDDPAFVWMLPDDGRRARFQEWFSAVACRYAVRWGGAYTTASRVEAAALWLPPGVAVDAIRMLRAGMWAAPFKLGPGGFRRMVSGMGHVDDLHKESMKQERHWYLMTLGVDPPRQGQGIGSALIQPVLARADAEALPCYLETTKERNLAFYRRHGFDVLRETSLPPDGPPAWTMVRPAQG